MTEVRIPRYELYDMFFEHAKEFDDEIVEIYEDFTEITILYESEYERWWTRLNTEVDEDVIHLVLMMYTIDMFDWKEDNRQIKVELLNDEEDNVLIIQE